MDSFLAEHQVTWAHDAPRTRRMQHSRRGPLLRMCWHAVANALSSSHPASLLQVYTREYLESVRPQHRNPNKARGRPAGSASCTGAFAVGKGQSERPSAAFAACAAASGTSCSLEAFLKRNTPCQHPLPLPPQWYEIVAWWWHVLARTIIGLVTGAWPGCWFPPAASLQCSQPARASPCLHCTDTHAPTACDHASLAQEDSYPTAAPVLSAFINGVALQAPWAQPTPCPSLGWPSACCSSALWAPPAGPQVGCCVCRAAAGARRWLLGACVV